MSVPMARTPAPGCELVGDQADCGNVNLRRLSLRIHELPRHRSDDVEPLANRPDRAANRLAMALLIAALIISSAIVMTVGGGPTLLGLPAFGLLGFVGAVAGGVWLLRATWRSGRRDGDD